MAESATVATALKALNTAVAVAAADSGVPIYENAAFFRLFPSVTGEDETIFQRIPDLDRDKLQARIARGRRLEHTVDVQLEARTVCLKVVVSPCEADAEGWLLIEAQDISKQREAEYMLDSYSKLSEKTNRELQREKERVEKLLLNIMPRSVYEELKDYGTTTPQRFDDASVLVLDFVDFTDMAIARDPGALVAELNDIFSAFDRIVELFDCERIKTIGDAYMAVSGLPDPNTDHAANLARVALRMKRYLEKRNAAHPTQWRFRIGIASGPLIGSIVGIHKYVYDVFGPAANLAARLEGVCEPMKITVCQETHRLIDGGFATTPLAEADIKGFGRQQLFTLDYEARG